MRKNPPPIPLPAKAPPSPGLRRLLEYVYVRDVDATLDDAQEVLQRLRTPALSKSDPEGVRKRLGAELVELELAWGPDYAPLSAVLGKGRRRAA